MKKQIISRALLGIPLGVFICTTITILISLVAAGGAYWPVVPQLVDQTGSEIKAVILQYVLSGVLGAACAGSSCVWDMQGWSLLKQTIVHYIIIAGSMFPVAWLTWWMPHTLPGALVYFGIFMAVYAVLFAVMFLVLKRNIQRMNSCIQQERKAE